MKFNCVIDTCSYINLHQVDFNRKPLLGYLYGQVNILFSPEVNKEIEDHFEEGMPSSSERRNNVFIARKFPINEYERRILGRSLRSRTDNGWTKKNDKDKGEVDNFILSIDQIHHLRKIGIVFITDDMACLRGVLKDWIQSFPTISTWTSYEVVVFLYIENVIPSRDLAIDLIRELQTKNAPPVAQRTAQFTQELIKQFQSYDTKLKTISKLI
jgi:hypothetical protein